MGMIEAKAAHMAPLLTDASGRVPLVSSLDLAAILRAVLALLAGCGLGAAQAAARAQRPWVLVDRWRVRRAVKQQLGSRATVDTIGRVTDAVLEVGATTTASDMTMMYQEAGN